ncbi:expressed unknown protein [Seminavis robusta]|uniref:Uncharacterized protein n=1 Tax=Seminavis robusta TaxID=568900 RepID=A0A9N8DC59_9STRA|nr:expressed unknown protein [Seminavis robusta]|eukprot:Sro85_g045140.1 n/a (528) ;mRNA; r:9767-11477
MSSLSSTGQDLLVPALLVVLQHDRNLLSLKDLGNLSIGNKTLAKLVEDCAVWKTLFEEISAAPMLEGTSSGIAWHGEEGLLPCFTNPDPRILQRVGYKHALGLLVSKTCQNCGILAGSAGPISLKRLCKICSKQDSSSWICVKTKAKDMFLLNDKDLAALPSATVTPGMGPDGKMSTLFSYEDVKQKSFQKWGGESGLEAEMNRRIAAANRRYKQRQNTTKPMKKKPKVIHQSTRPADNPDLVVSHSVSSLPIGCMIRKSKVKRTNDDDGWQPLRFHACRKCNACGRHNEIWDHSLIEHDLVDATAIGEANVVTTDESAFLDLRGLSLATELVTCLANCTFSHHRIQDRDGYRIREHNVYSFVFEASGDDDRVKIVFDDFGVRNTPYPLAMVTALSKIGTGPRAHERLFETAGGPTIRDDGFVTLCNEGAIAKVMKALGMTEETSPVQFLAGLFARIYTSETLKSMTLHRVYNASHRGYTEFLLLEQAISYLNATMVEEDDYDDDEEDWRDYGCDCCYGMGCDCCFC